MKLIVGLGNPGKEYQHTRHNVGFICVDKFLHANGFVANKDDLKGQFYKDQNLIVLKPMTYMNLSGESVRAVMDYYKIAINDLLVVCDDVSLPVGKIRLRTKGSSGGHNGLKNIIANIGSENFKRIRVGIASSEDLIEHVLGKFSKEEAEIIDASAEKVAKALKEYADGIPFEKISSKYNQKD